MKKLFLLCFSLLVFAAGPALAGEIKIGLMAPLTGAYASEGEDMRRTVQLLADELNKAGGIKGQQVKIIVADDGSNATTAARAAHSLTTQGVRAVIGTYGSAITEASQPIYNKGKILQVATGSTAIRLSEKDFNPQEGEITTLKFLQPGKINPEDLAFDSTRRVITAFITQRI